MTFTIADTRILDADWYPAQTHTPQRLMERPLSVLIIPAPTGRWRPHVRPACTPRLAAAPDHNATISCTETCPPSPSPSPSGSPSRVSAPIPAPSGLCSDGDRRAMAKKISMPPAALLEPGRDDDYDMYTASVSLSTLDVFGILVCPRLGSASACVSLSAPTSNALLLTFSAFGARCSRFQLQLPAIFVDVFRITYPIPSSSLLNRPRGPKCWSMVWYVCRSVPPTPARLPRKT
ncbi:hypothetical protein EVG20_g10801 [Dentipellis fragilis]|uniref:Uncharacterized protein n=1 Tax=Dentipellis fragilis TaxID=205917 RepID=A0A4Y9XP46_9AGAM|nr:hypothetical protein EVG20_g10801 [Dentipellis fragilis]